MQFNSWNNEKRLNKIKLVIDKMDTYIDSINL